uniref:Variant surface glycoprotein 1125.2088 n=1 Tax=Trypanosoma brucei TaxID=5691 RepID=A0A1J0R877_9TRYP|nr:variant surface glycoprotein 1125.2088 [Trypanosoma brucei]
MGNCAMDRSGEALTIVADAKTPKIKPAPKSVFETAADRSACIATVTNAATHTNTQELLAYHVCKALQATQFTTPDLETLDGNKLAASSSVVNVVRNCHPKYQQIADPTAGDDSSKIKEFIKNAYGSSNTDFVTGFITNADDAPVPVRSAGEKGEQAIKTISTPEARLAALSHLEAERTAREVVAKTAGAGAALPQKSEDCKDEKDETKCNKKYGCEFKNGNCEAKVTTKTGTTTNTTVSNSFETKALLLFLFLPLP